MAKGRWVSLTLVGIVAIGTVGCTEGDNKLVQYEGKWTVVKVNGALPLASAPHAIFNGNNVRLTASCNTISADGFLHDDMTFHRNSGAHTLASCGPELDKLDFQLVELMGSSPLFTDNADGTLTIEAAPYSLLLRPM